MITLLHPSRGRAEKARETYDRWMKKSSGEVEIEHVLSIDDEDESADQYFNLFHPQSTIVINANKNLVEATNFGAKFCKGDIIILLSDDFDCCENWDKKISRRFIGVEDKVLKTFDGTQNWIVTLPIMDRVHYEKKGYFYYPEYQHMFCDTDMTHMAELEGKLIYLNNATDLFIHHHYSTGATKKDAVNEKADSTWDKGQAVYLNRVKNKFGLGDVDVFNLSDAARPHINWLKQRIQ